MTFACRNTEHPICLDFYAQTVHSYACIGANYGAISHDSRSERSETAAEESGCPPHVVRSVGWGATYMNCTTVCRWSGMNGAPSACHTTAPTARHSPGALVSILGSSCCLRLPSHVIHTRPAHGCSHPQALTIPNTRTQALPRR